MAYNANVAVARCKPTKNDKGSFDVETLKYFLPAIRMISEMQIIDPRFTNTNKPFVFMVYLTNRIYFEFGFDDLEEAENKRLDIIGAMSEYWGPDNMIFANGFDYEVTTVGAVADITEIITTNQRYVFKLVVPGAPYPVRMVFNEEGLAQHARQLISKRKENDLRGRAMGEICMAVP